MTRNSLSFALGTSTGPTDASQMSHEPIVVSTCDTTTPALTTMSLTSLQPQGMVSTSPLATSARSGGTLVLRRVHEPTGHFSELVFGP